MHGIGAWVVQGVGGWASWVLHGIGAWVVHGMMYYHLNSTTMFLFLYVSFLIFHFHKSVLTLSTQCTFILQRRELLVNKRDLIVGKKKFGTVGIDGGI